MLFALVGYATCSSLMLIMNKVAVYVLPVPSFVLLCQFIASWSAVKLCGICGCFVVDDLECIPLLHQVQCLLDDFDVRSKVAVLYVETSNSTNWKSKRPLRAEICKSQKSFTELYADFNTK